MLRQSSAILRIRAASAGLKEFTQEVRKFIDESNIEEGVLTIFCRHTSASLVIQENAAPAVRHDLESYFARIAPELPPSRPPPRGGRSEGARDADAPFYEHDDEGPDDMPAHLRAAITQTSLSIPLLGGRLALGTWQGIYLFEHRRAPHRRSVALHLIGE